MFNQYLVIFYCSILSAVAVYLINGYLKYRRLVKHIKELEKNLAFLEDLCKLHSESSYDIFTSNAIFLVVKKHYIDPVNNNKEFSFINEEILNGRKENQ